MLTAKGHIEIIDTEYSIRTAKAIIEEGSMLINPVSSGADHIPTIEGTNKIYSQYGIGLLAIFIPILTVSKLISFCFGVEEVMLSHFLLSFYNIPFALLGLWHFREILKSIGQNHETANFLMICLATGTIFWKYVVTDFSEVTQISLLLGAIHSCINKRCTNRWLLVSAYLSLLILLKLVYVVVLPPFIVLAVIEGAKEKKIINNLARGATFLTLAGFFVMTLNWLRFGNILESGYGSQQSAFSWYYFHRDWIDYLFSFDRGIFTFSPLLLVSVILLKNIYRIKKSTLFLLFWIVLSFYLLTASWIGWKGGYCWGNRNLVPIVPVFAILWGVIDFKNYLNRYLFLSLLIVSLIVQIVGVSVKTHEWSVISTEFKDHPDPYYVPSELKGNFTLFYEKLMNSSGVYDADTFVTEHHHQINLNDYKSFNGYNFWIVHLAKLFTSKFLQEISLLMLTLISLLTIYVIVSGYMRMKKSSFKKSNE